MSDNPFAFPSPEQRDANGCGIVEGAPGMTLRDYFAGQALEQAIVWYNHNPEWAPKMARLSYSIADAMLAERKKGGDA